MYKGMKFLYDPKFRTNISGEISNNNSKFYSKIPAKKL